METIVPFLVAIKEERGLLIIISIFNLALTGKAILLLLVIPNLFQTTDGLLYINFRQSGVFAITTDSAIIALSPSPVPLNQWSYFAVTRSGSVFRIWLNGVSGTPATANLTFASTATAIRFGDGFSETLNGYIDEYRITKGVAREITLPTAPFPDL